MSHIERLNAQVIRCVIFAFVSLRMACLTHLLYSGEGKMKKRVFLREALLPLQMSLMLLMLLMLPLLMLLMLLPATPAAAAPLKAPSRFELAPTRKRWSTA
jgi:hypothetical protein